MIDKNGRLFGKLNIVDLIIIIIIAALIVFAVVKITDTDTLAGEKVPVEISFFHEEAMDFVVNEIEVGLPVWDYSSDVQLGTLVSFEAGPSRSYVFSEDGLGTLTPKEGYNSLSLVTRVDGIMTDHGVEVGGTLYGVGHTLIIYVGQAKLYLTVSGVAPVS